MAVGSGCEVGLVPPDALGAPGRLLPVLLPSEGGEVEEVVGTAGALEPARVNRVRAVHGAVHLEKAVEAGHVVGLVGSLHRFMAEGGVLVQGAVVELVVTARRVDGGTELVAEVSVVGGVPRDRPPPRRL